MQPPSYADGGHRPRASTGPVSRRQPRYQRAKPHHKPAREATAPRQAIAPERLMSFCSVLEPSKRDVVFR
jgi:hypothetical protein